MKKLSILFFTIMVSCSVAFGQDSIPPPVDSVAKDTAVVIVSIPDTLCLPVQDSILCLPTGDGKEAFTIIKDFFERNKDNWPDKPIGWIALFVTFILSVPGVTLITKSKSIFKFLSFFLRKTLNVVLFVAMLLTGLVTYLFGLVGNKGFDWSMFLTIWGFMSFAAVWAYHQWFEKKEDIAKRLAAKTDKAEKK